MRHVIIGSGPAGVVAAETLRKADPAAEITLLCGEGEPPYSRMAIPYLLKGEIDEAGTHIRKDANHYDRLRIKLVQARAQAIDTAGRAVDVGNGRCLPYDRLLIATGSRPSRERIPGIDFPGVQACWTLQDARTIVARARPGTRVVQMGAGFVGCIIMEGLLSRGVDLTILVRSGYMVRRMMNPTASALIQRWCEAKGVKILTRTQPKGLSVNGGALRVDLGEGRTLPADVYLSVVGVDPNLDFLAGSGIEIGQGILVDANLQSSVPGVYAAGPLQGQLRLQRAHDPRPGLLVVRGVAGRVGRRIRRSAGRVPVPLPEPAVRRRPPDWRQLRGLLRARRRAPGAHRGTASAGDLEAEAAERARTNHEGLPLGCIRRGMKITLKLFASLAVHLPAEARSSHKVDLDVDPGTTVLDVIRRQGVPEALCAIVLIDGVWVARPDRATRAMSEGQVLAVWPPIAGG